MSGEPTIVNQSRRWILALLLVASGFVFLFLAWICFWPWPSPLLKREEIPWEPDAIVVLGSGGEHGVDGDDDGDANR